MVEEVVLDPSPTKTKVINIFVLMYMNINLLAF